MNKITSINTGFLSFIVEPVILVYFVISITFIGNSIELFKESLKGIDLGGLDFISGIVGIPLSIIGFIFSIFLTCFLLSYGICIIYSFIRGIKYKRYDLHIVSTIMATIVLFITTLLLATFLLEIISNPLLINLQVNDIIRFFLDNNTFLPKEIEKLATITLIANFLLTIYSIINIALLIKNKKMQTN